MIAAVAFAALMVLIGFNAPVGFAMAVTGALGLWYVVGFEGLIGLLTGTPHAIATTYEFLTIPMFLLMAEFVLASGIADDLFRTAAAWLGRMPGGLGAATAMAGAGFGAICGSSTASAATLSSTALKAMVKQGYTPRMASGVVAISGTLAMLIPPSIAMIVYGFLANVSIAKVLIAGLIPGLVVTLTIILTIVGLAIWKPEHAPKSDAVPFAEKIALLRLVLPMVFLFAAVTITLYSGIATPTEVSAIGAVGAFAIYVVRCRPHMRDIARAVGRATMTSCMIVVIILGARIFSTLIALTQTTQNIVSWIGALPTQPWVIILALVVILLLLGCFLDLMAILVITVPIMAPLVLSLGYDLIWWGVIMMVCVEVGLVTPPVGLNSFVVAKSAGIPASTVFWGVAPHVVAHLMAIAVLLLFPVLSLWLPSHL
jgi:C4-dicarboxylate transporter, DctM subunit